jgi:hypothetical protein
MDATNFNSILLTVLFPIFFHVLVKNRRAEKGCNLNCTAISKYKANNMPFVILDSNYVTIFQNLKLLFKVTLLPFKF